MKNTISIVLILLFTVCAYAQQGINYKALIKDNLGNAIASQTIDVRFTIIADTGPTNVYLETHTSATTDANGIVILTIGEGTTGDVFADIEWGSDIHSLKAEIDIEQDASFVDMGTTQFMAVPYALQAKTATTATELTGGIDQAYIAALEARIVALEPPPPALIGDYRDGGVVFWVDPTDPTHGLVCAIEDQSSGIRWHNGSSITTGATGIIIGTGSANTDAIIAVQGPVETDYAAGLARAYAGGGYNDWFLPSKDELNQMYINKAAIDATALSNGGTAFSTQVYWSSTEINASSTWLQFFNNGDQAAINKFFPSFVRAVRAF